MFEKVNPNHPDKVADRIAGALVDLAYTKNDNPKIAVEVLLGHGKCLVIAESSEDISYDEVAVIVNRILGLCVVDYIYVPQDPILAQNQEEEVRCGDNGIFKGCRITAEQQELANIAGDIYDKYPTDGKYILAEKKLVICQSNAKTADLRALYPDATINPLGDWTGGYNVDSGATNRKLGSDMGDAVTGGGLHGKDLSKADVSLNIYCHLLAQSGVSPITMSCAIGDTVINSAVPYREIVARARKYVTEIGGFEKLAEWGLIRPLKRQITDL